MQLSNNDCNPVCFLKSSGEVVCVKVVCFFHSLINLCCLTATANFFTFTDKLAQDPRRLQELCCAAARVAGPVPPGVPVVT